MSQLLPLLKKCLSCDPVDGPLMVSALTCVKEVLAMEEGKDVTADLIASLYPQWLEIAVASSSAPMSGLATNSNLFCGVKKRDQRTFLRILSPSPVSKDRRKIRARRRFV